MVVHPENHMLCIIQSEHRVYPEPLKKLELEKLPLKIDELPNETQMGHLRAPEGIWSSCICLFEPIQLKSVDLVELEDNENAISIYITNFSDWEGELFLIVGTVKDYKPVPVSYSACYMHVYRFVTQNGKCFLELQHKTQVEDLPTAFCGYRGTLLAGIGNNFRLYQLGKKKLLKKAELKGFQTYLNNIHVLGERIYTTDLSDSFHILKFKLKENTFFEFADDVLPRWITASTILDYNTVIGADKFENLFVLRIPQNIDEDVDDDPVTYKFKWEAGYLNGAAYKLNEVCAFFLGEVATSLVKTALVSTSNEVIIYGTTNGSIGALYPFESKEMYLRIEAPPLSGREHLMFRSSYGPVKCVIDGDLCEQFSRLSYSKQKVLSEELDRTPAEVLKKLDDIRNRIL